MHATRPYRYRLAMAAAAIVSLAACGSDPAAAPATTEATFAAASAPSSMAAPTTSVRTTAAPTTAATTTRPTTTPPTTTPDSLRADLQAILDAVLLPQALRWDCCGADAPATGISALVRVPGKDDLLLASGTNLDGSPFDAQQQFMAGSLGNSIVKTLALQLIDEEILDPATTVDHWRADLPNASTVTVADLLQNTHGWGDYGDLTTMFLQDLEHLYQWEEVLAIVSTIPPLSGPGTFDAEGDTPAMAALLYIVEQVSGSTFKELVASRIAHKLQLEHTTVFDRDPEPADLEDGVFVVPGGAGQLSATAHNAYRSFHLAGSGVNSSVTDEADLIDAWVAGTLFAPPRPATPERFLAARASGELTPDVSAHVAIVGDGVPISGYCPCEVNGDLVKVAAIGRTPQDLGTDTFALQYPDGITVVVHVNSSEVADRTQIRTVADQLHDAAASA